MNYVTTREIEFPTAVPETVDSFLRALPGVHTRHSGATLYDHLRGVEQMLRGWGCREEVCSAGLFHSVYGTEFFRQRTLPLDDRERLQRLIGTEAEALAFAFSNLDNRQFLAETTAILADLEQSGVDHARQIDARQLDLLHIWVANWLEQLGRLPPIRRGRHTQFLRDARSVLLPPAVEALNDAYGFEHARLQPVVHHLSLNRGEARSNRDEQVMIVDDFVPEHLALRLTALTERNIWRYGWKAAKTQTSHGFWHSHFAGDNGDEQACCEHELQDRPLAAPILELWHLIRDQITPGHVPVRVYANGHTYGGDGNMHTDCDRPGHWTSIYYAHAQWDPNWAGETVFFDPEGRDVLASVYPKPGRLVHFPGQVPHAARTPSRECPALRAVFVVKSYLNPDRPAE